MTNSKSKIKDVLNVGIGNVAASAISAIFWLYVATILGTEKYGEISYLLAIANIAYVVCFLGSGNTITVFTAKENKIQSTIYVVTVMSSAIITIITFFLVPIILPLLFPDFEESVDIIQIMSLALVPSAISIMIISNLLANEKIQKVVIGQAISLIILIGGIFVLKENFGIIGAAIAFVMSNIIAAVYYYIISKY